jgi:hypothetical protein
MHAMNKSPASYRFSLRDLFLFTLACSLLLFEWKMWGTASLLGTLTTLVCGAAFAWFFAARPFKNTRSVTVLCIFLSLGNCILLAVLEYLNFHYITSLRSISATPLNWVGGFGIAFISLLVTTAILVALLQLMIKPNWSLRFPLLIVFNSWFGLFVIRQMIDGHDEHIGYTFGSNLLRGYGTAMAVFAVALVLRWVKSLPTSQDDLAS